MTRLRKLRLIEFLIVGIAMGVLEDIIAIVIATDAPLDLNIFWVVLAVAIPFAIISEVIVDHPRFWEWILPPRNNRPK
ncbi:MAG: hypothetical protein WEA04_03925 [Candidatus Andersenbacteria bacterium]